MRQLLNRIQSMHVEQFETVHPRDQKSVFAASAFRKPGTTRLGKSILRLACFLIALSCSVLQPHADAETILIPRPEQQQRRTELVYEGMASYGNYRVFGAAENAKLYTGGVELDRELWPNVFHTRVDGVVEILPFVLLTQPEKTDIWGNPLTRTRKSVPGAGITPIGFRLLWRDGKRVMPYFVAKGSVLGFTQKALSSQATYENWSFHLTQGIQMRIHGRYDLRLGMLSDLHFSNANIVRSNPALDVMNAEIGVVYHLGRPKWPLSAAR
jgi:hypothetical protein